MRPFGALELSQRVRKMRPASFASRRDQTSIDSIDPSSAANIRWLEARAINLFPVRFWGTYALLMEHGNA